MSTTTTPASSGRRGEQVVQAVIMLAVAGMAGAASFTHVHDWTMHNSPAGTGDWFGWANAMVSELIPLAAGLEARRRIRHYGTAGTYPIALIIAAVALSLTGQFAEAKPSISGWLISAVPALGFLALVKLVLSSPTGKKASTPSPTNDAREVAEQRLTRSALVPSVPEAGAGNLTPAGLPAHLLASARFAATNHRQNTGQAITAADLAVRISVTPTVASKLLDTLNREDGSTRANGHRLEVPVGGLR